MKGRVLNRYDPDALASLFKEAGTYAALEAKGFGRFEVEIDEPGHGLPHTRLFAWKRGERFSLLDTCITESSISPQFFRARGYDIDGIELLSLYWLREEDPTAVFTAERPQLPLQRHPGLGVLRSAFQVVVHMARELGKDGVACMPKFFHDAAIFFRSRLFLFLDGAQQGRFEALLRDLCPLPLGTASLLLAVDGVRDVQGHTVRWDFSPQVCPLHVALCAYFNSAQYAQAVASAFATSRFTWSADAVTQAQGLPPGMPA